ncbi:MAG: phosphohistidine-like domain-containing protein, partial [Phycisphaeraceae bacterium]
SGTDLATSIDAAHHLLDARLADWLRQLLHRPADSPEALAALVRELTEARHRLHEAIVHQRDGAARRDLLYVDLGVEAQLRAAVERVDISHASEPLLVEMSRQVLSNLMLIEPVAEYRATQRMWEAVDLPEQADRTMLLAALAAVDRTARAVRQRTDQLYERLQPKAAELGRRCAVEAWTIPIFSEEVVRGTLMFVLSKLVRHLEPALRRRAGLGGWQIIAPGEAVGRVQMVGALRDVQGRRFDEPTVVVADEVAGDEDIPRNVRAVLTRQTPDIVSHVAVRARNEHVLLASCLDASIYEQLDGQRQRRVRVTTTADGDVRLESAEAPAVAPTVEATPRALVMLRRPRLSNAVLGPTEFDEARVGGKANNLRALRDKLPAWIAAPPSAALSFGVFEHVLDRDANSAEAAQYRALLERVDEEPDDVLPRLREVIAGLSLPEALRSRIEEVCRREGIALLEPRDALWRAIRQVWASKWNERAYRARRRLELPHADLVMAVLIQLVIPADYAFVLHTTDPTTADANTLYGEIVVGLGETLVGNHPGTPLGFRANKQGLIIELVSLPSKSIALRSTSERPGVIVRSDSNGEDLPGYAGAGLHDSVFVDPPRAERLDYADEPLVRDRAFCERLCRSLAALGVAIENAAGSPQDIEGAVAGEQYYALQTRAQVGL